MAAGQPNSMSFAAYLLTALAMLLVIEGLLYALFTEQMRKLLAGALMMPPNQLRNAGIAMAAIGFMIVWCLEIL
jgi:uncharacterized protein YjeT (DUF2065 family)